MATLKEANLARDEHAEYLRKELGAHGILVDKVKEKGKDTFGVVALYENEPRNAPESLEIKTDAGTKRVPLRAEVTSVAELE